MYLICIFLSAALGMWGILVKKLAKVSGLEDHSEGIDKQ